MQDHVPSWREDQNERRMFKYKDVGESGAYTMRQLERQQQRVLLKEQERDSVMRRLALFELGNDPHAFVCSHDEVLAALSNGGAIPNRDVESPSSSSVSSLIPGGDSSPEKPMRRLELNDLSK